PISTTLVPYTTLFRSGLENRSRQTTLQVTPCLKSGMSCTYLGWTRRSSCQGCPSIRQYRSVNSRSRYRAGTAQNTKLLFDLNQEIGRASCRESRKIEV